MDCLDSIMYKKCHACIHAFSIPKICRSEKLDRNTQLNAVWNYETHKRRSWKLGICAETESMH
jgi:hypothetical protein